MDTSLRDPYRHDVGWAKVFEDDAWRWRRLFSEFLGTFFLVMVAAGAPVVNAVHPGSVPGPVQVVAPGLMVMAIIYFMGMVSGAHLNPAVTIAFSVRGHFPLRRIPGYLIAQLAGAAVAGLFLRMLFGTVGHLGATLPGSDTASWKALVVEMVLTLGLMSVILGTASGARNVGHNAAIAVGGYIILAGLWAAPVSGASMNPARSFGPVLVSGHWSMYWIYIVGPVAGALAAVVVAWALRGSPSQAANIAAQGRLEEAA